MSTSMNDWNAQIIEEFRSNDGKVGGNFEGAPILLLHTIGAKSGLERINPMMYQDLGEERIAVFASKAGADTNPDWYRNLVANPEVTAEIGTETRRFRSRTASSSERAHLGEAEAGLPRVRRVRGQHGPRDPRCRPRARLSPGGRARPHLRGRPRMSFDTKKGTRGARQPSGPVFRWINSLAARRLRKHSKVMGLDALVLTTVGRKSGLERTTPVGWIPDTDHSWLIVASAAGAVDNPAWYYNLAANPEKASIRIDGRTIAVAAEQLHGAERQEAWQRITSAVPRFLKYETKTDARCPSSGSSPVRRQALRRDQMGPADTENEPRGPLYPSPYRR